MVGEAVEQGAREALRAEGLGPFIEGHVGGDEHRGALVALGDHFEEQLGAGLRQRHEDQLVDDQKLVVGQLLLQSQESTLFARLHELVDQRRGGDGAHRKRPLARGRSQNLLLPLER